MSRNYYIAIFSIIFVGGALLVLSLQPDTPVQIDKSNESVLEEKRVGFSRSTDLQPSYILPNSYRNLPQSDNPFQQKLLLIDSDGKISRVIEKNLQTDIEREIVSVERSLVRGGFSISPDDRYITYLSDTNVFSMLERDTGKVELIFEFEQDTQITLQNIQWSEDGSSVLIQYTDSQSDTPNSYQAAVIDIESNTLTNLPENVTAYVWVGDTYVYNQEMPQENNQLVTEDGAVFESIPWTDSISNILVTDDRHFVATTRPRFESTELNAYVWNAKGEFVSEYTLDTRRNPAQLGNTILEITLAKDEAQERVLTQRDLVSGEIISQMRYPGDSFTSITDIVVKDQSMGLSIATGNFGPGSILTQDISVIDLEKGSLEFSWYREDLQPIEELETPLIRYLLLDLVL